MDIPRKNRHHLLQNVRKIRNWQQLLRGIPTFSKIDRRAEADLHRRSQLNRVPSQVTVVEIATNFTRNYNKRWLKGWGKSIRKRRFSKVTVKLSTDRRRRNGCRWTAESERWESCAGDKFCGDLFESQLLELFIFCWKKGIETPFRPKLSETSCVGKRALKRPDCVAQLKLCVHKISIFWWIFWCRSIYFWLNCCIEKRIHSNTSPFVSFAFCFLVLQCRLFALYVMSLFLCKQFKLINYRCSAIIFWRKCDASYIFKILKFVYHMITVFAAVYMTCVELCNCCFLCTHC